MISKTLSAKKNSAATPDCTLEIGHNAASRLIFHGDWTVMRLDIVEAKLPRLLGQYKKAAAQKSGLQLDLQSITRLDTAGAWLINKTQLALQEASYTVELQVADPEHEQLLSLARYPEVAQKGEKVPTAMVQLLNNTGKTLFSEVHSSKDLIGFFGYFLLSTAKCLIKPKTFRFTSLCYHMEHVGMRAIPIVSLLAFLIGLVVAYMGAEQLARFGASVFAINLLEIVTLREMAGLLTAIVVAGRSGSAFTAQIGAMKSNQEVAAMQSMGLDPMTMLVVPRILALIITLPILFFIADVMGLVGGAIALWSTLGITPDAFLVQLQSAINMNNFYIGMLKAPFFAAVIGIVGCFRGFQVTGSAESVGQLTTRSVVESIFLVIILDALFAIFFTRIGI